MIDFDADGQCQKDGNQNNFVHGRVFINNMDLRLYKRPEKTINYGSAVSFNFTDFHNNYPFLRIHMLCIDSPKFDYFCLFCFIKVQSREF